MLIVPRRGALTAHTECGIGDVTPGENCVMPRGMKMRIESRTAAAAVTCAKTTARRSRCRNVLRWARMSFANDRDFLTPAASVEGFEIDFEQ